MVGWFATPVQSWPISASKQVFKQQAADAAIDVPAWWLDSAMATEPYLIKRDRSAFGEGMRGPFPPGCDDPAAQTQAGEYADAFKMGQIARAWYWGPRLAVLELFSMPALAGDGRQSFDELWTRALPRDGTRPHGWADLGRLQGVAPETVVSMGRKVLADYRYVSPLNPTVYANHNRLPELGQGLLKARFEDAGRRLWPRLPGANEAEMVFVLDAIVDASERPWFLEINSNPQLHPDIYPVMLERLTRGWFQATPRENTRQI